MPTAAQGSDVEITITRKPQVRRATMNALAARSRRFQRMRTVKVTLPEVPGDRLPVSFQPT